MRKLIFILSLFLSVTVSGQLSKAGLGSVASSVAAGGTTNYGQDDFSGTNAVSMTENYIYWVGPITIVDGGTIASINWWISTNLSTDAICALYTNNPTPDPDEPYQLVANSTTASVSETNGIYNVYTPAGTANVSSATIYWLAILSTGGDHLAIVASTGGSLTVFYESGTSFPATATPTSWTTVTDVAAYVTVQH